MDLFSLLAENVFMTAAATILGSVITYLITKSNNSKDLAISDRTQLSRDQYQLIAELRQMMFEQREELESLKVELRQLQAVNINLTIENEKLQNKINLLNHRLDSSLR